MFQFTQSKNEAFTHTSATPETTEVSVILVSKEDIYRDNLGSKPTLLLKKGYEVTQEDLPRFIRNGAKPHQFYIKSEMQALLTPPVVKNTITFPVATQNSSIAIQRRISSNTDFSKNRLVRHLNEHRLAMIMDTQPKSLKRTVDCLFKCGFSLDRIHPVRVADYFHWAIKKYDPDLLMVSYTQTGSLTGLDLLVSLPNLSAIQTVILLLSDTTDISPVEMQLIVDTCEEKKIKIVSKPVSRFVLKDLLIRA